MGQRAVGTAELTGAKDMKINGSEHLDGMPVFVTGATNVIGTRLVPALLAAGAKVTTFLRSRHRAGAFEVMGIHALVRALEDTAVMETTLQGQ